MKEHRFDKEHGVKYGSSTRQQEQAGHNNPTRQYNHQDWERQRRFLRFLIRAIGFNLLARIDRVEGLENLPAEGPGILMINHIAFIDSLAVLHVVPRHIVPLAKIEVYDYPVIGLFPRMWGVIPVRREEVDRRALQMALDVLRANEMILVAPEATRHTALQRGKEGVAYLATRSGAPIIPVAIEGTPGFPTIRYSHRWHGPGVQIRFGRPFRLRNPSAPATAPATVPATAPATAETSGTAFPAIASGVVLNSRPGRELLRLMTDEALYELAKMLPENRRGVYADLSKATQTTLEFI